MNNLKQFSKKLMALQEKIDSDKELIEAYSQEVDFREPITLQELIDSHRHLREANRVYHERWKEVVNAAVNARVVATINNQYVLWSDLEKMTLVEIVESIGL